jgi:UDP-3-O-acyl N-acetylglucosamine deacetylase
VAGLRHKKTRLLKALRTAQGMCRPKAARGHARKANTVRVIGYRNQRTLAGTAAVPGVGFITGARVTARFHPAPADTGVVFRRVDLWGAPTVPARAEWVSGTDRRTTLGPPESGVTLVEHVLASLSGERIDNCIVDLDGPEPPGLDGSAQGFVDAIADAGAVFQSARRPIYAVSEPMLVRAPGATLVLHPREQEESTELRASYILNYGLGAPLSPQTHSLSVCPATFTQDLSRCRTFVTEAEVAGLRSMGIGKHLTPADLLVFGKRGPINNRVRFADEPARHKILDLIGDLALCGFDLAGHIVAYRSGHALNVELARLLAARAAGSRTSPSPKVCTPAKRAA